MTKKNINLFILVLFINIKQTITTKNKGYGGKESSSEDSSESQENLLTTQNSAVDNQETQNNSNEFNLKEFQSRPTNSKIQSYLDLITFIKGVNSTGNFYVKFEIEDLVFNEGKLQMGQGTHTYSKDVAINTLSVADERVQSGLYYYKEFFPEMKYEVYGIAYLIADIEHLGDIKFDEEVTLEYLAQGMGNIGKNGLKDFKNKGKAYTKQDCESPDAENLFPFCLQNLLLNVMKNEDYQKFMEFVYADPNWFHAKFNYECESENFSCVYANCLTFRSANVPDWDGLENLLEKVKSKRIV